jgi:F-type H+-transporting ATPase subunit delta
VSAGVIGRRYAQALLNLAAKDNQTDNVAQGLNDLCGVLDAAPALKLMLHSPEVTAQRRAELLADLLKRTQPVPLVGKFLSFLEAKRRLPLLHDVRNAFLGMADELLGRASAQVTVAIDPVPAQRERLLRLCQKLSGGKQVNLAIRVDPEILGGSVVRIGSKVWDGSLRNDLDTIRSAIAHA